MGALVPGHRCLGLFGGPLRQHAPCFINGHLRHRREEAPGRLECLQGLPPIVRPPHHPAERIQHQRRAVLVHRPHLRKLGTITPFLPPILLTRGAWQDQPFLDGQEHNHFDLVTREAALNLNQT